MKKKVGIIGSRKLSCILTEWMVGQKEVDIVGVVPPPFTGWWNDELREVADKLMLPIYDDLNLLVQQKPDIVFSINYWKIIDKDFIDSVPMGFVNIHHSYLLKYKGRYSTSWAIINARKFNCWEHGTTLHFINERLDEGKIISSYKCEITENDTAELLFEKVENLAIQMFKDNFSRIINDNVSEFIEADKESFYYDIESNKNLEVPYGLPMEELYDFVRAWSFKSRPRPYFSYKGKKIYLNLSE